MEKRIVDRWSNRINQNRHLHRLGGGGGDTLGGGDGVVREKGRMSSKKICEKLKDGR